MERKNMEQGQKLNKKNAIGELIRVALVAKCFSLDLEIFYFIFEPRRGS